MTAALQVEALAGGYGRLTVFRGVDLALEQGQTIGLLGANGAGKTTLLKTIVGALPSTSGRVMLDGRDVTRMLAFQRARTGLSLVPEGRHILGTLRYMLPWMAAELEEIDDVFNGDPWPYGIEPNRPSLEALVQYLADQALIEKPVLIETLFVPGEW